jgi:hypothetical protein
MIALAIMVVEADELGTPLRKGAAHLARRRTVEDWLKTRIGQEASMGMIAIEGWYEYVRSKDRSRLVELLHPDVVFESPVVHTPQVGRDITMQYLISAASVLGGPGFAYVDERRSDHGAVLEFTSEIDGIKINGVDVITINQDGSLITRFKVMIRPLKAIELVHRRMVEQLSRP